MANISLNRKGISVVALASGAIYLSITEIWNLAPVNIFIEIVFITVVIVFLINSTKQGIQIKKDVKKEYGAVICLFVFYLGYMIYTFYTVSQTLFETLLTAREMYYFCIVLFFASGFYDYNKCVKILVKFEIIGSILWIAAFILRQDLSPIAPYPGRTVLNGGVPVFFNYSLMPILYLFTCTYLLIGIIKKDFVWSLKKDCGGLLIILVALFLHFHRTDIILTIASLLIVAMSVSGKDRNWMKKWRKQISLAFFILLIVCFFILSSETMRIRLIEGWTDIQYAFSGSELNATNGTFTLRVWIIKIRWDYLIEHNKLLFGLGMITSRNKELKFGTSGTWSGVANFFNPDNAYANMLVRYGILGVLFFISVFIFFAIRLFRQNTKLSLSVFLYIIMTLIRGFNSAEAIAVYGLLWLGMLIGLCMAEKSMNYYYSDKLNAKKRIFDKK